MQNQHLLGDVRIPMRDDAYSQKLIQLGPILIGLAAGLAFVLVLDTSSVANYVATSRVATRAQPVLSGRIGQPSTLNHAPLRVEQATAGTPAMSSVSQQSSSSLAPVAAFFAGCLMAVAGLAMRFQLKPQSSSTGTVDIHALASIGTVEEMSKAPDVLGDDPDPNSLHRRMEAMLRAGQESICKAIEESDGKAKFRADAWQMPGRGGGISRVLADGNVWEKAGINLSVLKGQMPQEALGAATEKAAVYLKNLGLPPGERVPFFVASLSCVMHPRNPFCPTMHFNYRYFELDKDNWWFAGGTDITPAYLDEEDMKHFHGTYKKVCDKYDKDFYPKFKKWADEYFLIKHRGETRGLGGIFFDDLNDRDPNVLFEFAKECLNSVAPAYVPIIEKHKNDSFTEEQKRWQLLRRGRYTEFNLVYDRGTIFGLKAGGRIESILMTIPETARWEYNHQPAPGSEEEKIMNLYKNPRDWV